MRQYKIATLILLMNVFNANARSNPDDFSITHYTTENGLPQNSVKAIAMDQFGFYWLATEMGLVRFDGHNFKLFNKQNTGINSNRFIDIQKAAATDQLYGVNEHWTVLPIKNGSVTLPVKEIGDFFNFKLSKESYNHRSWKFDQERDFGHLIDSMLLPVSKEKTILLTKSKIFWFLSRKQAGALTIENDPGFRSIFNIGENLYRLVAGSHNFKIQQLTPKGIAEIKLQGDILAQKNRSPLAVRINSATGQTFISSGDCLFLVELNADGNLNTILILSGFELNKKVIHSDCYDKANDMLM
jgi:ligand-binding sensor domain-containing protein